MTRWTRKWFLTPFVVCWAVATLVVADDAVDVEMLEQRAFRAAVDRVAPSVVRIETVGGMARVGKVLFGDGPTTGLIVDPDGYVVSSAFGFVNRPASILVRLADGTLEPAELVATDHNRRLVLLKIETEKPLPVPEIVPRAEMRTGQWAIAVGRTFEGNRPNMAIGILSAVGRIWGKAVQTDAAVSPNNYGGPLIDVRGRVLGVLVPLSPQAANEIAGVQWYDSGIGFAVDAEHVMSILPRLRKGEDLHPGVIGVNLRGSNPSIGEPVITACRSTSPAAKAGMKVGDRIVEIEGRKIVRAAGVKEELARRYAGATVHVVVLRDEERLEYDVELVARLDPYQHGFLGVLPMRDPNGEPGVTVRHVYPGSLAASAGIEPGDVIVSAAGEPVGDRDELLQKIGSLEPGGQVKLEFRRGTKTIKCEPVLGRLPENLPPPLLPPARTKVQSRQVPRVLASLGRAMLPRQRAEIVRGLAEGILSKLLGEKLPPALADLRWLGIGPQVSTVPLKVSGVKNDAWAYVPQGYDPAVSHGVVIWLQGPGEFDWEKLLTRWKAHCDRDDLILLVPRPVGDQPWQPGDEDMVGRLLGKINSTYTVDSTRVVAAGHEGGGTLAYKVGFGRRSPVRAAVAIDAQVAGQVPQLDPRRRLAVYLTTAVGSRRAGLVKKALTQLRDAKIPVTVKDLGQQPRDLNPDELAELLRWIDMLDRI